MRTLIAIQISEPNKNWENIEPTYHEIDSKLGGKFAIVVANSCKRKVRLTYPDFWGQPVTTLNGYYFDVDHIIIKN